MTTTVVQNINLINHFENALPLYIHLHAVNISPSHIHQHPLFNMTMATNM